ncbi:MAG TPA: protein kinase, partial [Nannocystaceae bacterium]|nr:protein kinase [Nannocystaceae bacterium]
MACPDENTLVAFASGSLSMADASLVDEHLDVCPTCFALVAELARTAPEESEPTRLVPIRTESEGDDAPTTPVKPPSWRLPPPFGTRPIVKSSPPPPPVPVRTSETVIARVEPAPPDPPPPSQIGRHTLLHRIGADTVGVVYVAHDRERDRRVALKLIGTPRNPSDPVERTRIVREARMLAGLHHPNLLEVHDAGEIDGQLYVSMELVEGEPLDRWLLRPGKPWLERLGLFVQAGQGLAAAHAAGLVHRDFRPAHVIIDVEGRVRVTGFGFARGTAGLRDDAPTIVRAPPIDPGSLQSINQPVTMSGVVFGTPAYMAPEQYEGRGDARLDQYAFGIALYEALYRRRPFDANDPQTLQKLVSSGVAPPIPTTSEVPSWLGAIVLRAVQRDPERRFPDMPALLSAIALGLERRRKRRLGALVGAATVAAIVLVAGIAAAVGRAPCSDGEERLRGIWDAPQRRAAADSVQATGLPYAVQTWSAAAQRLDARALAWAQLHGQVCADAREGAASPAAVDPRVACLDRRLVELREIAALFTSADENVVEHAHLVVADWPSVESCAQAIDRAPDGGYPEIAKAHALVLAGRLNDAAPVIDRVVLAARDRATQ